MPIGIYPRIEPIPAFLSKFKAGEGCWHWTGAILGWTGYGVIKVHGKNTNAHRFSYELFNGPIPEKKMILHNCHQRNCVNPTHLRIGTHQENMKDMVESGHSKNCSRWKRKHFNRKSRAL